MNRSIYVIGPRRGSIKVGIAFNVRRRLYSLQNASAIRLVLHFAAEAEAGAVEGLERTVHNHLRRFRRGGEWFDVAPSTAVVAIRQAAEAAGISLTAALRKKRPPSDWRALRAGERVRIRRRELSGAILQRILPSSGRRAVSLMLDSDQDERPTVEQIPDVVPASAPSPSPPAIADELPRAREATAEFIAASRASATSRAYASDWRDFQVWCTAQGFAALPAAPETVAVYLSSMATRGAKVSTIRRRSCSVAHAHRSAGHPSPVDHEGVRATLAGICRKLGTAPCKKAALTAELLAKAVRKIPADVPGLRDRALLLIGFAAALRRSELVALNVEDVERHPKGIVLIIRRSKTDQAGQGIRKAIPHGRKLGAVAALDAWLAAAKITNGPLFRGVRGPTILRRNLHDGQVARIVKKRARQIGLDPKAFSGHSLRSGYITTADEHGASLATIAHHAGHAKIETTAGYVQVADAFRNHSGKDFL